MIRLCTCTGRSAANLQLPRHREASKVCKSCGGKLSVDGRGALSGSMLSTVELSGVIDPDLNWKKATKGRQRAVRRARTSFTTGGNKNSPANSSKKSTDTSEKETKRTEDMPVSESEKLGVSILGRRFSETLESVPIKKRRFLLVRTPSPPPQSPPQLDDSSSVLASKTASYGEAALSAKEQVLGICSGSREELGQGRIIANKSANLDMNAKLGDNADFSGISILAAAACDSNMGFEVVKTGDSVSKAHYPEGEQPLEKSRPTQSQNLDEEKGEDLCTFDKVEDIAELPSKICTTLVSTSKGSDEEKTNNLKNQEEIKSSPRSSPIKTRTVVSSSRDGRFHWDLNIVMDVWECNADEVKDSDPASAHIVTDGVILDEDTTSAKPCQVQQGHAGTTLVSQLGCTIEDSCKLDQSNMQVKPELYDDSSAGHHDEGKECGSRPEGFELAHEKLHVEDPALPALDAAEESGESPKQENASIAAEITLSSTSGAQGFVDNSLATAATLEVEKVDSGILDSGSNIVTEVSSPLPVLSKNASIGHTSQKCESDPLANQNVNESIDDCCPADDPGGEGTHLENRREENQVSHSPVDSGKNTETDALYQTAGDCSNIPVGNDASPGLSDSHAFANKLLIHAELSSGSADMEIEDANCNLMVDEDLNAAKPGSPVACGLKISAGESSEATNIVDAPPLGALSSTLCSTYVDGDCPGELASQDHFDCDNDSDASEIDADQAVRMEKVELLVDDDSQYEDGEFRESIFNSWGEEGETERLDYGSDCRETDAFDAYSDLPASVSLHLDIAENTNGPPSDTVYNGCDGEQLATNFTQNAVFQSFTRCPSVSVASDASSGKKGVEGMLNKVSGRQLRMKGARIIDDGAVEDAEFDRVADVNLVNGKSLNENGATDSKTKLSGWDQLPKACNSSAVGMMNSRVDSASRDCSAASLGICNAGDSVRRVTGSSRRELSSRLEKPKPSDGSHMNGISYAGISRDGSHSDVNTKAERDSDTQRSIGRDVLSLHLHGRGRGEHWGSSYKHWGPGHNESPSYYGSTSFRHHGSNNAAAAAVAKVESNGFVVASDGTLVKPGGVGPSARVARRYANASSPGSHHTMVGSRSSLERDRAFGLRPALRSSRELSPDRHIPGRRRPIRYGSGMVNTDHRERYQRPGIGDDVSSVSVHHPLSSRDHSFSPRRRHFHVSRSLTKSPSRSRTRSPVMWTSPRDRSNKMDGSPGLRRRSRSPPNFRPEGRLVRISSPHRQPDFMERMVGYSSPARDHCSPSRGSRWVNDRKNMPDRYREHEYKQSSERSSPTRVFSRSHRFNLMDSPRRLKLDEYYRPSNSGRFSDVRTGRGSRHDDGDDRKHFDRSEMYQSMRQYDHGCSMKQFSYDGQDGFRGHSSAAKVPSEFQRRGSPRGFERGIEREAAGSPRRVREEKNQFRYGRNGKRNDNIKLFDVRDCADDMAPIKRRPS